MALTTNKSIYVALLSWSYQFAALFIGLWLTRNLFSKLGEGTMGWWTQTLVLIGYLSTLDFGLSAALPREVANEVGRMRIEPGRNNLPQILAVWGKFALLQIPCAMALALVVWFASERAQENRVAMLGTMLAGAVFAFPFRLGGVLLRGLQDFTFDVATQMLSFLTGATVTVVLLTYDHALMALGCGWGFQMLIANGLPWLRILTVHRALLPGFRQIMAAKVPKALFAMGAWCWISSLGTGLLAGSEILALGWYSTHDQLFSYANTVKLVVIAFPFCLTLGTILLPAISAMRGAGDRDRLNDIVVAYTEFVLCLSCIVGVVVVDLNRPFVAWWLGEHLFLGQSLTWAAIFCMNVKHFLDSTAIALFSLGEEQTLGKVTLAGGVISLGISCFCVAWFGPLYAICGPLSVSLVSVPIVYYSIRKVSVPLANRMIRVFILWVLVLPAIYGTASFLIGIHVQPKLVHLVLYAVASVGLAVAGLIIPVYFSELGAYLRSRWNAR